MSEEWYADDLKTLEDFSKEVWALICSVESQQESVHKLKKQKETLLADNMNTAFKESRLRVLDHTINALELDNKEKINKLEGIKEAYLAEDIVGAMETMTSAEIGLEISDEACDLMKRINDLVRETGGMLY